MSGPAGPTGPTGITGRRGLQGTPYGAPGTTFYSPSGRVPEVNSVTSQTYVPSLGTNSGSMYCITSAINDPIIYLPGSLTSDQYGSFWIITNSGGGDGQRIFLRGLTQLTLSGVVLTMNPIGQYISIYMSAGETITFVFVGGSGSSTTYIAF